MQAAGQLALITLANLPATATPGAAGKPSMLCNYTSNMILGLRNHKECIGRLCIRILLLPLVVSEANAQSGYTWDQVKTKFEAANPTLKADSNNVDELKAEEITAFLRPNSQFTLSTDGPQIARYNGVWQPTRGTQGVPNIS
jgi:hypothetical protein